MVRVMNSRSVMSSPLAACLGAATLLVAGLGQVPAVGAAETAPLQLHGVPGGVLREAEIPLGDRLQPVNGGARTTRLPAQEFSVVGFTWRGEDPGVSFRTRSEQGWSTWAPAHGPDPRGDGGSRQRARLRRRGPRGPGPDVDPGHERPPAGADRPRRTAVRLGHGDRGGPHGRAGPPAYDGPDVGAAARAALAQGMGCRPRLAQRRARLQRHLKQIHVHHTATGNSYSRADVPGILRGMYRYHTHTLGWFDIGYNFLVDRFGRAWVGRSGGAQRLVRGAHTLGFNHASVGVAMIGNLEGRTPWRDARHHAGAGGRLEAGQARPVRPGQGHGDLDRKRPLPRGRTGPAARHRRTPRHQSDRLPGTGPLREAPRDPRASPAQDRQLLIRRAAWVRGGNSVVARIRLLLELPHDPCPVCRRLAVRQRPAPHRPRRRFRRALRRLQQVHADGRSRRPHGLRNRRARHPAAGRGRQGGGDPARPGGQEQRRDRAGPRRPRALLRPVHAHHDRQPLPRGAGDVPHRAPQRLHGREDHPGGDQSVDGPDPAGPLHRGHLPDLRVRRGARRPVRQLRQPARPDRPRRTPLQDQRRDARSSSRPSTSSSTCPPSPARWGSGSTSARPREPGGPTSSSSPRTSSARSGRGR